MKLALYPEMNNAGYLNFKSFNKLSKEKMVEGLPNMVFNKKGLCDACQKGKQLKSSFKLKPKISIERALNLLHMDLFGPVKPNSIGEIWYTLVVVDVIPG